MKVMFSAGSARVEVEGKDAKDCFTQIAGAMEVFRNTKCGKCGCPDVVPQVRENDGNHFYELKCSNCAAELSFGQKKIDGSLYPRRKDKEGNWLEHGGWIKWQRAAQNGAAADAPF